MTVKAMSQSEFLALVAAGRLRKTYCEYQMINGGKWYQDHDELPVKITANDDEWSDEYFNIYPPQLIPYISTDPEMPGIVCVNFGQDYKVIFRVVN
jgi:hypothetical protein